MKNLLKILSVASVLFGVANFAAPARAQDRVRISGGRRDGYDTAYCPNGYQIESCRFDRNSCDNTSQTSTSCSADSHEHRECRFEGICRRVNGGGGGGGGYPGSDIVYIRGGRTSAYDTTYCPSGYRIRRCDFNTNTCDNLQTGYNFCSADSHEHRQCSYQGECVRD